MACKRRFSAALAAALLAAAGSAGAGPVTQVAALDPDSPFALAVDFGTEFSGNTTFDSSAANGAADPLSSGAYAAPLGDLSLSLGGLTLAYDGLSMVSSGLTGVDLPMLPPPPLSAFDLTNSFLLTDTIADNPVELDGAIDSPACTGGCALGDLSWPLLLTLAIGLVALTMRRRSH